MSEWDAGNSGTIAFVSSAAGTNKGDIVVCLMLLKSFPPIGVGLSDVCYWLCSGYFFFHLSPLPDGF
jgi:hypothetical protein